MRIQLKYSGPSNEDQAFYEVVAEIDPATPADTHTLAGEFMEHATVAMYAMNERATTINEREAATGEDA